jgi:hypothetical protein
MKTLAFLFVSFCIAGIAFTSTSCDKCDAAILADLTSEVAGALFIKEINADETARTIRILNNFINNGTDYLVKKNCDCSNVNATNSHTSRWKIHFSDDPFASFDDIVSTTDTIIDVYKNKLEACDRDSTGLGLELLTTGIYIIENILDADFGTPERNDTNNTAFGYSGRYSKPSIEQYKQKLGNNYSYAVIRVTDLPIRENGKPAFRVIEKF